MRLLPLTFQWRPISGSELTRKRRPAEIYNRIARRTLLQGDFLTRPSPCGLDCAYSLKFAAPSLRCAEATALPNLSQDLNPSGYNYIGVTTTSNDTILGQSSDRSFVFAISYQTPQEDSIQFISCVTMGATYNSQVVYTNGTQSITLQVTDEHPLNASSLEQIELFYDVVNPGPISDPIKYPTEYGNQTEEMVMALVHGSQLRAMSEAMINCLTGSIQYYGTSACTALFSKTFFFWAALFLRPCILNYQSVRFEIVFTLKIDSELKSSYLIIQLE